MAQVQSLHARMLVDSRMRDIRRRVEVIQKKLADLQEMGVPCAFCYSSVRNTGSIFTLGDKRITDVIERYRNEILCNLMEESRTQAGEETGSSLQEIHLILPVLPAPLEELSRATLQSMIVGILKDLGIRWSDPKPVWWPEEIPFVPPRSVPENYTGSWLSALKAILKSVYSHFSYDIDAYIASKLESQAVNSSRSSEPASAHECGVMGEDTEEDEDTPSEADADEETYSECEESEEERQAEVFHKQASKQETGVAEIPTSQVISNHSVVLPRLTGTNHTVAAPTSYLKTLPSVAMPPPPPGPPPSGTRQLSSFTVENILMSKQHSTSSGSGSVSSSIHSPTSSGSTPSLPSPTITSVTAPPTAAVNTSVPGSVSSSIVGVNWVSHPPVKYTKFTILSPVAMSEEAHGGRRSKDTSLSSKTEEIREGHPVATPLSTQQHEQLQHRDGKLSSIMNQVTYVRQPSSEYKPTTLTPHQLVAHQPPPPPPGPAVTSTTVRVLSLPPPGTTSAASPPSSGGPLRDSPTTASAPHHPSATTTTTSSAARLCTLPVVTSLPASSSPGLDRKKVVLSKTFPPSQQYVLLVPSGSAVSAAAATSNSSPRPLAVPTSGPLVRAGVRTVSLQPPPTSKDGGGSSDDKLERGSLSSVAEYNSLRLIAPKQRNVNGTDETDPRSSSSGSGGGNSGANRSRLQNNHHHLHQQQQRGGGGSHGRPPKLRFHMTTVVTKQKHAPVVRSSMTVSSPLAMVDESREHGTSGGAGRSPESELPMESVIMRSPNIFSSAQHAKPDCPLGATPNRNLRAEQQVASRGKAASENSTSSLVPTDPLQRVATPRRLVLQNGEGPLRGSRPSSGEKQASGKLPLMDQQSNDPVSARHRGRTTRSYTRRKRELTFHLYEDPGTAFRAKRTCKE